MLKKIIVLLAIALLSFSCSRLEIQSEKDKDAQFMTYYNSWDIQQMEEEIQRYIVLEGYSRDLPKYESMLEERKRAKKQLEDIVSKVREEILVNDLTTLRDYMAGGIRNTATLRELRKIDFTMFRIYTSKLKFDRSDASNIVALNLGEETFYYDINYEYSKGRWTIVDFKERR